MAWRDRRGHGYSGPDGIGGALRVWARGTGREGIQEMGLISDFAASTSYSSFRPPAGRDAKALFSVWLQVLRLLRVSRIQDQCTSYCCAGDNGLHTHLLCLPLDCVNRLKVFFCHLLCSLSYWDLINL